MLKILTGRAFLYVYEYAFLSAAQLRQFWQLFWQTSHRLYYKLVIESNGWNGQSRKPQCSRLSFFFFFAPPWHMHSVTKYYHKNIFILHPSTYYIRVIFSEKASRNTSAIVNDGQTGRNWDENLILASLMFETRRYPNFLLPKRYTVKLILFIQGGPA